MSTTAGFRDFEGSVDGMWDVHMYAAKPSMDLRCSDSE